MHLKRLTQSIPPASSSPSPPLRRPEKFDPNNMIGLTFQKNFGNFGVFTGKIISHRVDDAEGLLFKVKYPDEDEEELNPSELFLLFPFKSKERMELESVLLPPIDRQTLPDGWSMFTRKRKKDGRADSYFQSPSGDILRSITDVNRYLGRKTKKGSVHQRPRIRRLENMEKNSKKKKDENTTTERVFKDDDYDIVKRTYIQDLETKKWVPCTVYSRKGTTFQNDNRKFVVLYLPNSDEYEGLSRPYSIDRIGTLYDADSDVIASRDEIDVASNKNSEDQKKDVKKNKNVDELNKSKDAKINEGSKPRNVKEMTDIEKFNASRLKHCIYCEKTLKNSMISISTPSSSRSSFSSLAGRITCITLRHPDVIAVGSAPRDRHLVLGKSIEQITKQPICFFKIRQRDNDLEFENILEFQHKTGAVWDMQWEPLRDKRIAVCLGDYTVKILSVIISDEKKTAVKRDSILKHEGLRFSIVRWSPSPRCYLLTGSMEGCVVLWFVPQDSDSQFSNIPLVVFGTFFFLLIISTTRRISNLKQHTQELARTQH